MSDATGRQQLRGGVDLGGTKVLAVVVDGEGKVCGEARLPTPKEAGPEGVVEAMAVALESAARLAGVGTEQLRGVGVGAPGVSDVAAGTLAHARNVVADWDAPFPLVARLATRVGAPVTLGNDVQVAVQAEVVLGAGRGLSSLLGVWWGTGVGGGVVLGGEVWRGRGAAGELGHTLVKRGGPRCGCGRRGCLEAYAGRASMERRARKEVGRGAVTKLFEMAEKRGVERLTSGIWERAYAKGDPLAVRLVHRAVRALGAGVASAVNLLDVQGVVLGGGMGARLGPALLPHLVAAMEPHLFVPERPPIVRISELGDLAGAVGGALLADRARPHVG